MTIRQQILDLKGDELQEFYLRTEWYPQINDLIGGWCVMPLNEPPSRGIPEVADFIDEKLAKHIAELHNNWLQNQHDGKHV